MKPLLPVISLLIAVVLFGGSPKPLPAQCTGCANASFGPTGHAYPFASNNFAVALATADFNGDGIPDLALLDSAQPAVTILLGTGSGTLRVAATYPLDGSPRTLSAADFDGDGRIDLVVAQLGNFSGTSQGGVTVLFGDGGGGIRARKDVPLDIHPYALATADFNGDGRVDIAAIGDEPFLHILAGDGHGGFGAPLTVDVPATSLGTVEVFDRLFVGDFNNDGLMDLGISQVDGYVAIYLGSGGGDFLAPRYIHVPVGYVAVADLNRDGNLDLVVGSYVLLGAGDGRFLAPSPLPANFASQLPVRLASDQAIGDFNQDGIPDLIVVLDPPRGLAVAIGDGQGGFVLGPGVPGIFSQYENVVIVADFDSDGRDDLASFQLSVLSVARGTGNGSFESAPESPIYQNTGPLAVADFTSDGIKDVVAIAQSGGTPILYLLVSHGDGTFDPPQSIAQLPVSASPLGVADFNSDGKADIVVLVAPADAFSPSQLLVFLGDGAGHFGNPKTYSINSPQPGSIATADLNGDGRISILVWANFQIWLLRNNGNDFDSARIAIPNASPRFQVADVNGDGKADIVTLGPAIQSYLGAGNGTFAAGPVTQPPANSSLFSFADFDGDGKVDIAVTTVDPYDVFGFVFLFGDNTGAFGSPVALSPSPPAFVLLAGEFLNDGRNELAVAGGSATSIYRVDDLRQIHSLGVFSTTPPLIADDVTGDGKPDLVGLNYDPDQVIWVLPDTACSPRRIAMAQNVSSCDMAGTPFAMQPSVSVVDDGDNSLTCPGDAISASIVPGTGTPGAVLGGTTSVPVVSGRATFTNLSVNLPGRRYRLTFTDSAIHAIESRDFSQSLPPPAISSPAVLCTLGPGRFEAAAGYDTYFWTLDSLGVGSGRVLTLETLTAGPHTLGLTVSQNHCSASASIGVTPFSTPAAPTVGNNGPVPFGATIQLTSSTVAGATYQWTGPHGFTSSQQNPTVPNAKPAIAGKYRVTATVGGCASAAASTRVTVLPPPWCAGCKQTSFGPSVRAFDAGATVGGMAVGDFDGDGNLDVLVSHQDNPGSLTFFPGEGGGGFGKGIDTVSAVYPSRVVSADLNADGLDDLIQEADGQTYVLLATGGGLFGVPQPLPAIRNPSVGDFNEDGHLDLVGSSSTSTGVVVLLGDGTGSFQAPIVYPTTNPPSAFRVFDLNGDHHEDIAVVSYQGSISVFLGNGSGGFMKLPDIPAPVNSISIAAGDLDGDENPDLAIFFSGLTEGNVWIYAGAGNGTFAHVRSLKTGVFAGQLEIADVNGDGKNDLLCLFGGIGVFIGRGGFDFDPPTIFPAGNPIEYRLVDLDHDGKLDAVAAGGNSFVLLRGTGAAGFARPTRYSVGSGSGLALADMNQDGHPDVVVSDAANSTGRISILLNDGTGALGPPISVDIGQSPGGSPVALVTDDFNGDGFPDIAVALPFPGGLSLLLSDGYGGFDPPVPYSGPHSAMVVGDFNGDGKKDLAVADASAITVMLGDGLGNLTAVSTIAIGATSLAVRDFNHDGRDDLVAVSGFPGQVSLFIANPDGTLAPPMIASIPTSSAAFPAVSVGDFDNDGNPDVAVAADQLVVFLGDGSGGFRGPGLPGASLLGHFGFPGRVVVGDFNGDGNLDLALIDANVSTFIGDGKGGFSLSTELALLGPPLGLDVGDLDGDGKPDLVVSDASGGLNVLTNTNCTPRQLGATTSPSCSRPDRPLSAQPVVKVFDDGQNVVTCDAGQVAAVIAAGTGKPGAVLGGTTSLNAINGIATFVNLSVDRKGTGYQLEFHHPIAALARTLPFTVGSPPSPPTAGSNGPVCLGQTLQLTASTVAGGLYRWTGPNGFTATVQNPTIPNVTMAAAGTYSVYVDVNGCVSVPSTTSVVIEPVPSAVITAPASACPNTAGLVASVPDAGPGARYTWQISNGTITSGAGTRSITFSSGYIGQTMLSVTASDFNGCSSGSNASVSVAATCAMKFYTLPTCRVLDTRNPAGPNGGPALGAQLPDRDFILTNKCGIPATALAVSSNITVTQPTSPGDLRIHAGGTPAPLATSIYFTVGQTRANNAFLALGLLGDIDVRFDGFYGGTVQFILDVNGYFQ